MDRIGARQALADLHKWMRETLARTDWHNEQKVDLLAHLITMEGELLEQIAQSE